MGLLTIASIVLICKATMIGTIVVVYKNNKVDAYVEIDNETISLKEL